MKSSITMIRGSNATMVTVALLSDCVRPSHCRCLMASSFACMPSNELTASKLFGSQDVCRSSRATRLRRMWATGTGLCWLCQWSANCSVAASSHIVVLAWRLLCKEHTLQIVLRSTACSMVLEGLRGKRLTSLPPGTQPLTKSPCDELHRLASSSGVLGAACWVRRVGCGVLSD